MAEQNEQSAVVPATPTEVFDAWIDSAAHSAMTGAAATSTPEVGGAFTAHDGFITGNWEALERPRRIVMRWHTQAFPQGSESSRVEVLLAPTAAGTEVTVRHSNIPDGQGGDYFQGWKDKYYGPMRRHFGG